MPEPKKPEDISKNSTKVLKVILVYGTLGFLYHGLLYLVLKLSIPILDLRTFVPVFGASTLGLIVILGIFQRVFQNHLKSTSRNLHQFILDGEIDLTQPLQPPKLGMLVPLMTSLNSMTNNLNTIFLDITRSTRKFNLFASDIFFSARHLSDESLSQSQTMETIKARVLRFQEALNDLKDTNQRVLETVITTSGSFQKLEDTTRDAASRLEPLSLATQQAAESAQVGQEKIAQSSESVVLLIQGLNQLQESMETMNQKTSHIGQVIQTLEDIAERTHILATNASIEAARAGQEGKGFGVIASEIRNLATNSREAIQNVGGFLKEMRLDISTSSHLWTEEITRIEQVRSFTGETHRVLEAIRNQFTSITSAMEGFQELFNEQNRVIHTTLDQSEKIHAGVDELSLALENQTLGYEEIQTEISRAASNAQASSQSAKVLSQLGTYLRIGGQELKYVVTKFKVSEQRHLGSIARKEPRKVLLYNLEVFSQGDLVGHLGDLSPSGLLLYSDQELEIGVPRDAAIRLPLGFGLNDDVIITFTPRRIEKDNTFYRIGCSLESTDTRQSTAINLILDKLTIHDGETISPEIDTIEELEEI